MFVSRIRMQQDQSVKAPFHSIPARALPSLFISLLALLFATAGPASADAPLEVNSPITDNAKVLGTDHAKVETVLKAFTKKTGLHLYVVYVVSFDNLTGAEWAKKTAARSVIGSTDILLAISTGDNQYGVAEPREHAISNKEFNTVAVSDIRPTVDAGDWAGAAIDAAKGYEKASEASGLPWTFIVTGALLIALAGALGVHRTRQRYDETHVIRDQHGQPVDPFELLDTDELIDKAQLSVAGVEDPELKIQLGRQLSDLLSTSLRRTDDTRRALAIDIIHLSLNLGRTATSTATTENTGRRS